MRIAWWRGEDRIKFVNLVVPMKKVTAFVLLIIFLINIGGYSVMYRMAGRRATKELTAKLDKNEFSGSLAITIKIPVALPYQPNSDYERIDGEFEYQGQFYKLVKQRVFSDTLYVVCLIDVKKKQLVDDMHEYTRLTSESSPNSQSSKSAWGNPLQEYSSQGIIELIPSSSGWTSLFNHTESVSAPIDPITGINSPPPRA
jgi:hypothetical protein